MAIVSVTYQFLLITEKLAVGGNVCYICLKLMSALIEVVVCCYIHRVNTFSSRTGSWTLVQLSGSRSV